MLNGIEDLYHERDDAGNSHREKQHAELEAWIGELQKLSDSRRRSYFAPNYADIRAYASSIERYREDFAEMLGLPLISPWGEPSIQGERGELHESEYTLVAEDGLGEIYRVEIPVSAGLTAYGLFFLPKGEGPFPLVISQHGGQGTPELAADFFGSENYNDMTRRILRRGAAVFAPQLLLWESERFGPGFDRKQIDVQLKQLGSSITAIEVHKLRGSLDHLLRRPDIDGERVGMVGLSYGGFYTLFTAALDTRITVAVVSCFLNDRMAYGRSDWTWTDSGNRFLDAEVCGLICPRPLYMEGGSRDELFHAQGFIEESARAGLHYDRLGLGDRFQAVVFEGAHEFNPEDEPLHFLFRYL
ncbi:dienelactone hydrolase family protein [Paenibacillus sp. HB172176]|uniref:alpha/beta hydrolase family protein n=1 Tax=Paenibacillus sp. HB172176 TaxID=2493690 RepID=UPI00143B4976|nr:dienelactone hydrolase family protein [Paenibacillus sp. HB172176]